MTQFLHAVAGFGQEHWVELGAILLVVLMYLKLRATTRLLQSLPSHASLASLMSALPSRVAAARNACHNANLAARRAEHERLEEAREWVLVAVQVRGMVDPNWPERIPHASVLWNTSTHEMKAPEERFRRFSGKLERLEEIIGTARVSQFGAPPYKKLNDLEFLMLGVMYKY